MRIYTAIPRNFVGTQAFFDRESGLTNRGLCSIGMDSKSVILAPALRGDQEPVIRASMKELESAGWWRDLNLDAVVLYTWGDFRYRKIVDAAMTTGIVVAQVTDLQGVSSPVSDFRAYLMGDHLQWWHYPLWKRVLRTICKLPVSLTLRLFTRDMRNARTIAASQLFLTSTPDAARRTRNFVARLVGKRASEKVRFVPIPVNPHFTFRSGVTKSPEVVAVGRWDSLQKRTPLLISTITRMLRLHNNVRFRIFGTKTAELESWTHQLSVQHKKRVSLEGLVANSALAEAYQHAQVMLVSSAYEGCHNASAEAVCCGVSVAACRSPFLSALAWHASRNSGTLAKSPTPESLSLALLTELDAWADGRRNPSEISGYWCMQLHANRVAEHIVSLVSEVQSSAGRCANASATM